MGINVVVLVENRRQISLDEFAEGLLADEWGQQAWNGRDDKVKAWKEFEWEGKNYFSWRFTPRFAYLGLFNPEWGSDYPDVENVVQVTFLKVMRVVERLAGGPIYIGNDVVSPKVPEDADLHGTGFYLPVELDILLSKWREVDTVEVDDPYMIF